MTVEETQKLKMFFIVLFLLSLFFWAWALKNTIGMTDGGGEFDLGVVSFGTVLLSSSYMMGIIASKSFASVGKIAKKATTCTHIFVAINYLLGAYIGFTSLGRPGFGAYCVAFTGVWLGIAYYGHTLMDSAAAAFSLSENIPLSA